LHKKVTAPGSIKPKKELTVKEREAESGKRAGRRDNVKAKLATAEAAKKRTEAMAYATQV
jgi:hypothetical protein